MKVTTMSYGQFLVNSPLNFTGTYFADTVDGLEHDCVYRFLKRSNLTPALLREKMSRLFKQQVLADDLIASRLYDQTSFYEAFLNDLKNSTGECIIESPYITAKRVATLLPSLKKLRERGIYIVINTRNPQEHNEIYQLQAEQAIDALQTFGITVLYTVGYHRKVALLDESTVWEGRPTIVSQP